MRTTRRSSHAFRVLVLGRLLVWSQALLGCAVAASVATDTAVNAAMLHSTRADVRIASTLEDVEGCRYLRFLRASSAQGGVLLQKMDREKTIAELTERTQRLGGNVLLLKRSSGGVTGANSEGSAYFCPPPAELSGGSDEASSAPASGTPGGDDAAPAEGGTP